MTSCKDTPEKVTRDYIEHFDELCLILNKTSNGKLSSHEAVKGIEQWKERMKKLMERRENFISTDPNNGGYAEFNSQVNESTLSEYTEKLEHSIHAMRILRASGKLTSAIESAIYNGNSDGDMLIFLWAMSGTGMAPAHPKAYSTKSSGTRIEVESKDIPEAVTSELKNPMNNDEK